jgi:nucleotide-binding universal stress UspA family protein
VTAGAPGPVLFAYDGSDLSKLAIDEAAAQLRPGREAIVLTVWQTFNVGFAPPSELHIDAASAPEVRTAAEDTAADGAWRARAAGFEARSMVCETSPSWKGILEVADDQDASLIVLGSHGRSGFPGVLLGSVAQDVAAHSKRAVLIVHRGSSRQDGSSEV